MLISFSIVVFAQNISTVNVSNLSDTQIRKVIDEAQSRGLTIDQAIVLAEARGATPSQINNLRRRIQELQQSGGQSSFDSGREATQSSVIAREAFSEKAKVQATTKAKRIFGYSLFNNENLTFEPSVNIPTPLNYVLGIGDEVFINVWGASQQTYQLVVDQNGAIQVMDLGPIYVSGMSFEKARRLIKKRLVAIFSGLESDNPNTWSEVSLGTLRGIKINITGEVIVPGTYNLPSTATVFNALYLSGGPNENGSFRNIKLIRDGKVIEHIDVYDFLINSETKGNVQLRDQDILFIPTYLIRAEVKGAFKRNNYFELLETESLADLISYAGDFTDGAYQHRVSIIRLSDKEKQIIDVEKEDFSTFRMKNGDAVTAGNVLDRFKNRITIKGAVYRPGMFELTDGLTLSELIRKAEGVKEEVYLNRGLIIREMDNRMTELIPFNVDSVITGKTDFQLKKEDIIQISDIFSMREERFVTIFGEAQKVGQFPYHENMSLKDLIYLAGGFNEAASESFIEVSRRHDYQKAALETNEMVNIYSMNIDRDLQLDSEDESFVLKPYDNIYIRRAPSYFTQQTVNIRGELIYPGSYSIKSKTERISDLIKRAGGLSRFAFIKGATLERRYQIRGIDVPSDDVLMESSVFKNSIRSAQANLVELNLEEILKNPGSIYDFILKKGDVITIPTITEEVRVLGEVLNSTGLVYEKGKSVKYYIDKSGGLNQKAKKSRIYVLYANGTTQTTKRRLFYKNYPEVAPGCQIVIPAKPDRSQQDNTGKILGYASTLASLALAFSAVFR